MAKPKRAPSKLQLARLALQDHNGMYRTEPYDGDRRSTWDKFEKVAGIRLDSSSPAIRQAIEVKQIIENMDPVERLACMTVLRAWQRARSAK